jgi:hypothetical protein
MYRVLELSLMYVAVVVAVVLIVAMKDWSESKRMKHRRWKCNSYRIAMLYLSTSFLRRYKFDIAVWQKTDWVDNSLLGSHLALLNNFPTDGSPIGKMAINGNSATVCSAHASLKHSSSQSQTQT